MSGSREYFAPEDPDGDVEDERYEPDDRVIVRKEDVLNRRVLDQPSLFDDSLPADSTLRGLIGNIVSDIEPGGALEIYRGEHLEDAYRVSFILYDEAGAPVETTVEMWSQEVRRPTPEEMEEYEKNIKFQKIGKFPVPVDAGGNPISDVTKADHDRYVSDVMTRPAMTEQESLRVGNTLFIFNIVEDSCRFYHFCNAAETDEGKDPAEFFAELMSNIGERSIMPVSFSEAFIPFVTFGYVLETSQLYRYDGSGWSFLPRCSWRTFPLPVLNEVEGVKISPRAGIRSVAGGVFEEPFETSMVFYMDSGLKTPITKVGGDRFELTVDRICLCGKPLGGASTGTLEDDAYVWVSATEDEKRVDQVFRAEDYNIEVFSEQSVLHGASVKVATSDVIFVLGGRIYRENPGSDVFFMTFSNGYPWSVDARYNTETYRTTSTNMRVGSDHMFFPGERIEKIIFAGSPDEWSGSVPLRKVVSDAGTFSAGRKGVFGVRSNVTEETDAEQKKIYTITSFDVETDARFVVSYNADKDFKYLFYGDPSEYDLPYPLFGDFDVETNGYMLTAYTFPLKRARVVTRSDDEYLVREIELGDKIGRLNAQMFMGHDEINALFVGKGDDLFARLAPGETTDLWIRETEVVAIVIDFEDIAKWGV